VLAAVTVLVGTALAASPAPQGSTEAAGQEPARATTAAAAATSASSAWAQASAPNVVVIMTDDMREDDLQWMPHTRRLLGKQGVRFENAFASYPLCCPSRATFLTGQYTHNHDVWTHRAPWGFQSMQDEETLPVWMQRAGYTTAFIGKYLNGYGRQPAPGRDGGNSLTYVPPGWDDWRGAVEGGPGGGTYRFRHTTFNVNGTLVKHPRQYQTRVIGRMTRAVVKRQARVRGPFFLWTSYVAPHTGSPREPGDPLPVVRRDGKRTRLITTVRPKSVRGRFDKRIRRAPGHAGEKDVSDKPRAIRAEPQLNRAERLGLREVARQRAEALSVVDDEVRRTVKALRRAGQLWKTVIVFTSDNGYLLGEHRIRQGKILPYEPALAVPLLVRGPGVPKGRVRTDPFVNVDLAPTIAAMAGARPGLTVDGVDMWGVVRGGDRGWVRPVLTQSGPKWLLPNSDEDVDGKAPPEPTREDFTPYSAGLRTSRYLYVEYSTGETELYDMRRDPHQLDNAAGTPPYAEHQRLLRETLARVRECAGADCRVPLPEPLQG
jgi:arylsulfatase A-like enzyme